MTSAMLRLGVCFDLAIPIPFSGCSCPSLCRLSNVVILASRPRLPTPRWRGLGVRVFPVVRVILLPHRSEESTGGDGRWRVSAPRPFGCAAGSSFHHGPPSHRIFLSLPLQGSYDVVPRSSGFYPPHGYPASQALSPQYYPWICHPLPPSRSGVTVTGSVFYGLLRPQGRRTSRGKTHSLSVSRPASVHGGYDSRISGLAQPRLLAPLRTPIERVRCSLHTRVLPQASFRHAISGYALTPSWRSPSVRSRRVSG